MHDTWPFGIRFTLPLAAAFLAAACGVHSGNGPADSGGDVRPEQPGAEDATAAKRRPAPPRPEAKAGPEQGCVILEGLPRSGEGLPLPSLVAGGEVEVAQAGVMVELARTGDVLVRFELSLANRGAAAREVMAGIAWRTPDTGGGRLEPIAGLVLEAPGGRVRDCRVASPQEMHQPWVDAATWVEITVPGSGDVTVSGMYKARLTQADKPATLFGYPDRFADNWKNWDWPYTKAPEYAPVADRLRPFHGEIALRPAAATKVTLRCRDGEDWLRTMSHEQSVQKMRSPGTYQWVFADSDRPSRLGFEYLPGLPIAEETAVFEALVKARKDDLRARIRLSDLLRFGGDAARRAEVLADLLRVWPAGAKKQLLEGRNDVRAGAWVGRVIALRAAGKSAEASKVAAEGAKLLAGFETGGEGEMNGLALAWLEAAAESGP